MHILVIDDDATSLEIIGELLEFEDVPYIAVQRAETVGDVLQDVGNLDDIGAVFLDIEMPLVNGYEVLQFLRDEWGLAAPVVAYTVHIAESAEAGRMGFNGFVGKPLDVDRFPEQLQRILNGERVWEPR